MNDRLLVATRKGLFEIERQPQGQWQQTQAHFLGEPVNMVLSDPRDGTLYAALNLGHFGVKLWRRARGESEWTACAVPVYPPQPEEQTAALANAAANAPADPDAPRPVPWSLQQLWVLEAGGADEPGVLWAGTIPGGLFRSDDRGASWALNRPMWDRPERAEWFGGGYDYPGIHSICVDPRDSHHVSIAISCGGVWQTRNGGDSWEATTRGMKAGYMPPERSDDPNIQDPHYMVQCPARPDALWVQHHDGIFRSEDGGASWRRIEGKPSKFGFAVAVHPRDPETAWFVPATKDECRVPVDGKLVVSRTRDGGRSFEVFSEGLPPPPAYDLIYRHGLAVDDSGERLAMGSTTGGLWVSENGGERWTCVSAHLPPIYCVRFG
ncbi:exo-alpha-sialidase [Cupriavidus gilardii]|uniref:WD40/YVTN/BNR-like repeat-containing protein n=1 Tax=Cupriavidus gilardii TaxID=82541 RepID=UPI001EE5FEFF|nr:exo-alpha-sialidase [Cupriavidus gilardii]MCG5259225.1 exo-alpha-sialidase [Cupriavidus gilardii]MDF9428691.1 exo-alpha-sialidase [Cupriavidus gilardii]